MTRPREEAVGQDYLTELRDDAQRQARDAVLALAQECAGLAQHAGGWTFAAAREALALAESWAGRAGALAEAVALRDELASGARLDDPPAPAPSPDQVAAQVLAGPGAALAAMQQAAGRNGLRLVVSQPAPAEPEREEPSPLIGPISPLLASMLPAGATDPAPAPAGPDWGDRNTAIKEIRRALRERSGVDWSVKGDRGTAWGWIEISAPPRRRTEEDVMTEPDRVLLGELLALGRPAHRQFVSVSPDARRQYVLRARGEFTHPE